MIALSWIISNQVYCYSWIQTTYWGDCLITQSTVTPTFKSFTEVIILSWIISNQVYCYCHIQTIYWGDCLTTQSTVTPTFKPFTEVTVLQHNLLLLPDSNHFLRWPYWWGGCKVRFHFILLELQHDSWNWSKMLINWMKHRKAQQSIFQIKIGSYIHLKFSSWFVPDKQQKFLQIHSLRPK